MSYSCNIFLKKVTTKSNRNEEDTNISCFMACYLTKDKKKYMNIDFLSNELTIRFSFYVISDILKRKSSSSIATL